MKTLILTLILPFSIAYAQNEISKELSDKELKTKLVAVVKDIEVEGMLNKTSEFTECRTKFKFTPNDPNPDDKLKQAQDCFKEKLSKNPDKLKKLAEDLNLQSYGLIRSKNMQDITSYMGDKMYKAMTGIDRKEADRKKLLESLQFKNRKNIDQKDFIDMYMTQLGKSALFEISRYCFEDLRKDNAAGTDWAAHWKGQFSGAVNDEGSPKFNQNIKTDTSDAGDVFKSVTAGISSSDISAADMGPYFQFCTAQIKPLCDLYTQDTSKSSGAKSCLVMNRLQEMRKAIANTQKIQEQFEKMDAGAITLALSQPIKFYDRAKEESNIDNLTNVTSMDILKGGMKKNSKLDECADRPENAECEGFVVVDDSKEKALYNTEMQRNLEKEIALARVREAKNKDATALQKYLEENAYYDLLEQVKEGKAVDVEGEITKIFDAKKKAEIEALDKAIGKRQLSEADLKKDPNAKKDAITQNAKEAATERARLAQVVLFNNIITSHLKLYTKDGKEVGQNITAWKKEEADLKNATVDLSLFGQVQSSAANAKTPDNKDNTIVGLDMIDQILGKPKSK